MLRLKNQLFCALETAWLVSLFSLVRRSPHLFPCVLALRKTVKLKSHQPTNIENPTVDLPLGDINLLVVTDVHSWIGGHGRHEADMDVDYGDVLSFYHHLKRFCTTHAKDLFFVMNGDFMDGTGLSTVPPIHLTPLLEHMPWDAINVGNHELYNNETVEWIVQNFVPHWGGHFLSTNSLLESTRQPLGNRYTYLTAPHAQATILTFGFLFDFTNNCASTMVERVEDVVQQPWFVEVIQRRDDYDAILVMAHMHVTDPLVNVIKQAIRTILNDDDDDEDDDVGNDDNINHPVPILFITGHTHIRGYAVLDENAASFEAGRFLDTLGFVSFPLPVVNDTHHMNMRDDSQMIPTAVQDRFQHVFLDTNRQTFAETLGFQEWKPTATGALLTDTIHQTQSAMGLLEVVGCNDHGEYYLDAGMTRQDSLWRLYMQEVVPTVLTHYNESMVFVQGTGAFRYPLFDGTVVVDDIIAVCPFNDTMYQLPVTLLGSQLVEVLNLSTTDPNSEVVPGTELPYFATSTFHIDSREYYSLLTARFHLHDIIHRIETVTGIPISPSGLEPLVNPRSERVWTTTDLWTEYVRTQWPCQEHPPQQQSHDDDDDDDDAGQKEQGDTMETSTRTAIVSSASQKQQAKEGQIQEEKPITSGIFIVLVVCGLWIYQKRKQYLQRKGYIPVGDLHQHISASLRGGKHSSGVAARSFLRSASSNFQE